MSVLVRAVAALLACFAVAASAKDAASGQFEIVTLSNRADLISGGDALVEVRVPKSVALNQVRLSLNGRDVTGAFRRRARCAACLPAWSKGETTSLPARAKADARHAS